MTRKSVAKWINKALSVGVAAALKDAPHGREPMLAEEAKAWVVHLACCKPKEFGYAACRLPSTGPWLVTDSTSNSQFFAVKCRTTSGILPCESTSIPNPANKAASN
ncbi:MAG: helix-turn-helix domain-containing protein [Methylococcales bacterium]